MKRVSLIALSFGMAVANVSMAGQMPYKAPQEVATTTKEKQIADKEAVVEKKAEARPAPKLQGAAKRITGDEPPLKETTQIPRKSAAQKAIEAEQMVRMQPEVS